MKNKKALIIVSVIAVLAVFIYVQVDAITDEKTDYQWEWYVAIAALVLLYFLIILIIFLVNRKKYKQLCDAYSNGDYTSVINLSKCLNSRFLDARAKDNGRAYLAVAYLELDNNEKFLDEINKIQHEDVLSKKYFWLSVYSLIQQEKDNFEHYKECLINSKNDNNRDTALKILDLVERRQNGDGELAPSELELIESLKFKTLQNLLKI